MPTARPVPRRRVPAVVAVVALAAALAGGRAASAGPAITCAGGPDPWRFRPEASIAAVSPAAGRVVDVAASADPADGREWIALAWLGPGGEIVASVSSDGGCGFAGGGGGLAPVTLHAGGPAVAQPRVALRVDAGVPLAAVAWLDGDDVVVRAASGPSLAFDAPVVLASRSLGSIALAAVPAPAPRALAAAWLADSGGTPRVHVATASLAGGAPSWSPAVVLADLATGGFDATTRVELAADAAGAGGASGLTVLATSAAGTAHAARSSDGGASFGAWRRVDDGTLARAVGPSLASAARGASAWTVAAWTGTPGLGAPLAVGDAALEQDGARLAEFDGASLASNPVQGSARAGDEAAVAVADAPSPLAFVAWPEGAELRVARRELAATAPHLSGGCAGARLTGLDPPRAGGSARSAAAAALGEDLVVAYVDDRTGRAEAWLKRSDARPPVVGGLTATPAACGQPPRVQLAWAAPPCDVATLVVEAGLAEGTTDLVREAAPSSTSLLVEGLAPATAYWFRVRATDVAGHEAVSPDVRADTPGCSDALLRASVAFVADTCPAGGMDGMADPGESLRVNVRVDNAGTADARLVRVRPFSRSPFLTMRSGSVDVGDIPPGGFRLLDVLVDASVTAACLDPLDVLVRMDSGNAAWGDLLALPTRAACVPCASVGCGTTADASRSAPQAVCRGAATTLDGSGSSIAGCHGAIVHEWWSGGTLIASSAAVTRAPTSTTSYRLVTRCSTDLACSDEDVVTITVHPVPSLTVTEDPPPPHCAGDVVTLVAASTAPGATFTWDDGWPDASRVVSASETHAVTVRDANGCTMTRSVRVDLREVPQAAAGPDVADACGSVRIGEPGYPLLDYRWTPAAGLSSDRVAQPIAYAPGGTYVLTVTDPTSGCSSSDEVTVAVRPGPAAPADLRVRRAGASLDVTWSAPADPADSVRLYSADVPRLWSAGWSPSARRECEARGGCSVALPPDPLRFFLAVGTCAGGNEGTP